MSAIYVIVDPATGKPFEPQSWGRRSLYVYRTQGMARGVATRIGLSHKDVVRFVPAKEGE